MAFCSNCGQELVEGAKFCYNCGAKNEVPQNSSSQRKIVYDGEIHKCPNCGDILDAYESVCQSCGYEQRGTKATRSVSDLYDRIEQVTIASKVELIKTFPIPNTKEDLREFLIMSSSNIEYDCYYALGTPFKNVERINLSNAWLSKYEQAYQKAGIIFSGDEALSEIKSTYAENKKRLKKAKYRIWKLIGCVYAVVLGVTWLAGAIMLLITLI